MTLYRFWKVFPSIIRSSKLYWGAVKSLARPGRKQTNVSVRMAWISFGALPCRERNLVTARVWILLKLRASLTCFRACFLPGPSLRTYQHPGTYSNRRPSNRYCYLLAGGYLLAKWQQYLFDKCLLPYIQSWTGDRGSTVVKALRYKSEGRWFDSRLCHWNFSLT